MFVKDIVHRFDAAHARSRERGANRYRPQVSDRDKLIELDRDA
jgi:hypothetical protein